MLFAQSEGSIPEIEHHHCIGHGSVGNIDPCFSDDKRVIAHLRLVIARLEHGVTGIGIDRAIGICRRRAVMILKALHVAAELLLDLACRFVERRMRLLAETRRLENHTLPNMSNDIALKAIVVGACVEGDGRR